MDTSIPKRRCYVCKQLLEITSTNFYPSIKNVCRMCHDARRIQWQKDNPQKRKEIQERYDKKRKTKKNEFEKARYDKKIISGESHTPEQIIELAEKQNWRCHYCGSDITYYYERDHFIPLSKGGSNGISNIRLTCRFCNRSKCDKLPQDFVSSKNNQLSGISDSGIMQPYVVDDS